MQFNCIDTGARPLTIGATQSLLVSPSVLQRLRIPVALLSIALLAIDAIVSVAGHSHDHTSASDRGADCQGAHSCGHHHVSPSEDPEPSSGAPFDSDSKEDCALCRHFNQAVVIATVTIELAGNQHVSPVAALTTSCADIAFRPVYPARGPPSV